MCLGRDKLSEATDGCSVDDVGIDDCSNCDCERVRVCAKEVLIGEPSALPLGCNAASASSVELPDEAIRLD